MKNFFVGLEFGSGIKRRGEGREGVVGVKRERGASPKVISETPERCDEAFVTHRPVVSSVICLDQVASERSRQTMGRVRG